MEAANQVCGMAAQELFGLTYSIITGNAVTLHAVFQLAELPAR
jgi:hypothetical protein